MARRKKEENLHRKNRPKKRRKNAVLAVVLVLVLVAALALVGAVVVGKTSVIHPNMVLNGVEVGGMTVDKAEKALSDALGRGVKFQGGQKKGRIALEFYSADDREALMDALKKMDMPWKKK